MTREEIEAGKVLSPPKARRHADRSDGGRRRRSGAAARPNARRKRPAMFAVGEIVRMKDIHPATHTRLPQYVRGHLGTIELNHGCHVFPDTTSLGQGEDPQWLYTVVSTGRNCGARMPTRRVKHFRRRLGALSGGAVMNLTPQPAMRAAAAVPGIPRDEDGPVFREPWEAQAFAMALALHERGVFTWNEWAADPRRRKSSALRLQAIRTPARPITGTGWRRWKAGRRQGRRHIGALHRYRDAWDHAADRTPHGAPIELTPGDFG